MLKRYRIRSDRTRSRRNLDLNAEKVARSVIRDPRPSKRGQLSTHLQHVQGPLKALFTIREQILINQRLTDRGRCLWLRLL